MEATTVTPILESLNEVEGSLMDFAKDLRDEDAKNNLKEHMYEIAASIRGSVESLRDIEVLRTINERINEIADSVDPTTLMVAGFNNRFGDLAEDIDARISEIRSKMDLEDIFKKETAA